MKNWSETFKHPAVVAVIAAMLGIIANTAITVLGNYYTSRLEERRERREIVLELMRSNDRAQTLQRLAILSKSGLLPDEDGRLRRAVASSQIASGCLKRDAIPPVPPRIGDRLTGRADRDVVIVGESAVELRAYAEALRSLLEGCSTP